MLACLTPFMPVWATQSTLVINDTNIEPYTRKDGTGFLDFIINKVSQESGIKISLQRQPPERGLINANSGQIDGDLTRIKKISSIYPNLIRIDEKLLDWKFAAFSLNKSYLDDLPSMKNKSVGYIKGWKIYENKTQGFKNTVIAKNPEQLFRLLSLGRVDIVLYEHWQGLAMIKRLGLQPRHIYTSPIASKEMFIFLNKRHHKLVPKVTSILRKLKNQGFYSKAYKKHLAPYLEVQNK